MAAYSQPPVSKLIFQRCSFSSPKSQHNKCVRNKFFNHAVTIVMPNFEKVPPEITSVLDREPYWIVKQLPLSELIQMDFIEAFVKRADEVTGFTLLQPVFGSDSDHLDGFYTLKGFMVILQLNGDVYMLSSKTHIDTENCFALTPDGNLILNVNKDMYEELGLEGKPSTYCKKRCNRYDSSVCPSSLRSYFTSRGYECSLHSLHHRQITPAYKSRPHVHPHSPEESEETCSYMDFWEWLGAQAVGAEEGSADDYINTLSCPSPCLSMKKCAVSVFSGLITPHQVLTLINQCRDHMETEDAVPWISVTVHGFADSPISWAPWEHGFLQSGDNLYTYVIFPKDNYWLYKASGTYDEFS